GLSARKELLLRLLKSNALALFWSVSNRCFGIKVREATDVLTCGNNQAFYFYLHKLARTECA
uniref:hypothetical protein n=1 Tax=Thalassolituus oleivorans TaxID=187493 RepID=UPI0030C80D02